MRRRWNGFPRQGEQWLYAAYKGLDSGLPLPALSIEIPLTEIYEGVAFLSPEPLADEKLKHPRSPDLLSTHDIHRRRPPAVRRPAPADRRLHARRSPRRRQRGSPRHRPLYCLLDTLGCGLLALAYPACTKMLGPVVPGATLPGVGARVPGTSFELDPVQAAFNIGAARALAGFQRHLARGRVGPPVGQPRRDPRRGRLPFAPAVREGSRR